VGGFSRVSARYLGSPTLVQANCRRDISNCSQTLTFIRGRLWRRRRPLTAHTAVSMTKEQSLFRPLASPLSFCLSTCPYSRKR
jgi:hypothetical protein